MSNDECHTPDELFKKLPFNFTLDAAATKKNTKCSAYYTKKDDAFSRDWDTYGWVWCNPPYSRAAGGIENWISHAYDNHRNSNGVVMLTICDVSTATREFAWYNATEIVELSPRINFHTPGWEGKRTGGFQAYQLIIFNAEKVKRQISRWNWRNEEFKNRSIFK